MTHGSVTTLRVSPLADRVVIKAAARTEQRRAGLYIPDTANGQPEQGEVVAVGPGRFDDGKRVPMETKVGDQVLYAKYSGAEVTIDDVAVVILRESDVMAIMG
jgi:chaperonin GroES